MSLYLDNAATSFPKAPGVGKAMADYIEYVGANAGRGGYSPALKSDSMLLDVREQLTRLFNAPDPRCVIFTGGMTAALNTVIRGFPLSGGHVIVGALEHNSVMRPLTGTGVSFSRIASDGCGRLSVDSARSLIRENTRLMIVSHASNVCGTLAPVEELAALCREHGIPLVLDAAQTAGHYPVDFKALSLSALCVPAHKGLLGPQGAGALIMTPEFSKRLEPLMSGGTGSMSESEEIPSRLPDRFEAGTLPLPAICGWGRALSYIEETGVQALRDHELALTSYLIEGLSSLPVRLIGSMEPSERVGVVSIDCPDRDNGDVARQLGESFSIFVRSGLMCSPSAHRSLDTFPRGTVRISLNYTTVKEDIDRLISALGIILS